MIFFDVDTQNDFIMQNGKLSVSGAEEIIPKLKELTEMAEEKNIRILGSVDRHFGTEEYKEVETELSIWGGPFPMHCQDGTNGQKKVRESTPKELFFVENKKYTLEELADILYHKRNIIFEKQQYDVFTNSNTEKVLNILKPETVFVYGVATDYCVRAAAFGISMLGFRVKVVEDAIKEITPEGKKKTFSEFRMQGIELVKIDDVRNLLAKM